MLAKNSSCNSSNSLTYPDESRLSRGVSPDDDGCQFCDKSSCLICCAKKTICDGCHKAPTPRRVKKATSQLIKVQQHIKSGQRGVPAFLRSSDVSDPSPKVVLAIEIRFVIRVT